MPRLCLILLGCVLALAPAQAGVVSWSRERLPELRLRLEKLKVPSLDDVLTRQANFLDAVDSLRDARDNLRQGDLEAARAALVDAGESAAGLLAPVEWSQLDLELQTHGQGWGVRLDWGALHLEFGDLQRLGSRVFIHPGDHTHRSQLETTNVRFSVSR